MQPYFFPYIGYFQLLSAVDRFVFYDDVNYIKSGWVNRNKLFLSGAVRYITVPLTAASSFEKINKTKTHSEKEWVEKMLSSIKQSYGKAPYYKDVSGIVEKVLKSDDGYISTLAKNSITYVAEYLQLDCDFNESSALYDNEEIKGSDRVLDICRMEKAVEYWNLPGGKDLYSHDEFEANGVKLKFVEVSIEPYKQECPDFQSGLSIIDVMMFNDRETVKEMIARGSMR